MFFIFCCVIIYSLAFLDFCMWLWELQLYLSWYNLMLYNDYKTIWLTLNSLTWFNDDNNNKRFDTINYCVLLWIEQSKTHNNILWIYFEYRHDMLTLGLYWFNRAFKNPQRIVGKKRAVGRVGRKHAYTLCIKFNNIFSTSKRIVLQNKINFTITSVK